MPWRIGSFQDRVRARQQRDDPAAMNATVNRIAAAPAGDPILTPSAAFKAASNGMPIPARSMIEA